MNTNIQQSAEMLMFYDDDFEASKLLINCELLSLFVLWIWTNLSIWAWVKIAWSLLWKLLWHISMLKNMVISLKQALFVFISFKVRWFQEACTTEEDLYFCFKWMYCTCDDLLPRYNSNCQNSLYAKIHST